MRSDIISYINTKVDSLDVFGSVNGICEIRVTDKSSYPAEWVGGEFKSVNDYDFKKGIIYHRQVGNTTISESGFPKKEIKVISYPLRMVGAILRKGYNDDMVITGVVSKILENTTDTLSTTLEAINSVVNVTSWTSDKAVVQSAELLNTKKIADEYSYFYIDYTVTITIDVGCIDFCESDYVLFLDGFNVTFLNGDKLTFK